MVGRTKRSGAYISKVRGKFTATAEAKATASEGGRYDGSGTTRLNGILRIRS